MFDFFDNLCGCFSPELKRNIIEYLSSAKLNQQVIEEEKTNKLQIFKQSQGQVKLEKEK